MKKFSVLIPAYNPKKELINLVKRLLEEENISVIILVDDGSKDECSSIFQIALDLDHRVILLKHAINLGKGSALKMGLNYAYNYFNDDVGVVTVDADGQHLIEDVLNVGYALGESPNALIMGTRHFNSTSENKVPLRSKIGNILTVRLFQLIVGKKISDTQSGLRGIPRSLIPLLLKINNCGYEFELNMLICCKNTHRQIREIPINTIYHNNNQGSHFNPILDSLKIYFVLFRFLILSLSTFILDFSIFSILSMQGFGIVTCQLSSRVLGVLFNYPFAKRMVFLCKENNTNYFNKYITLVIVNCGFSLVLINFLVKEYSFNPIAVKVLVESLLCIANFSIQRDFVFSKKVTYEN